MTAPRRRIEIHRIAGETPTSNADVVLIATSPHEVVARSAYDNGHYTTLFTALQPLYLNEGRRSPLSAPIVPSFPFFLHVLSAYRRLRCPPTSKLSLRYRCRRSHRLLLRKNQLFDVKLPHATASPWTGLATVDLLPQGTGRYVGDRAQAGNTFGCTWSRTAYRPRSST
jgi:hypothetical protein